jgi:hypothetical protein
MANLNTLKPSQVDPIQRFVTGDGGAGKSHLIKAIYHTVIITFRHAPMNPELPSVLLMAPTGVAAININGTTVHTALAIPIQCGNTVPAMSDQRRTQMRLSLAELKLIIINEISMLSNMGLLHIHQRLKEYLLHLIVNFLQESVYLFSEIFFSYHQFEVQQYFQIIRMMHLICVIHGMSSKWLN